MSNTYHRRLPFVLGAALLVIANHASAVAGDGQSVYRCRVLGESAACAAIPQNPSESQIELVPGPRGRHLVFLGRSVEQAIAEARASGEEPTLRIVVRETPTHLSGAEAHERYLGNKTPAVAVGNGETASSANPKVQ